MADPKKEIIDAKVEEFREFLKSQDADFLLVVNWPGKETPPKCTGYGDSDALEALLKFAGETIEEMAG